MAKIPVRVGRPNKFENPDELIDLFVDYIDYCIGKNQLANMAGFRRYKVIPRTTLFEYERKPEYANAFEYIDDVLHDETLNNKSVDPTTKKLVLQSKFGYADKTANVNENTNTNSIDEKTIESINNLLDRLSK
jgi:hypothetical protein